LNDQGKGAVLVMGAGFLWGTLGILTKLTYSVTTIGPVSLAWFRLIFAIPLLALFTVAKRYRISLTRREAVLFVGFAFCGLAVFHALYFTSFAYTTVQHAVALLYTAPAFVAILSRLILKEHLTRMKIVAVALSILGTFLILGLASGEQLFASRTQVGDWLAVGSGLAYSTWYIFGKVLGKNREATVTSFIVLCFGAVLLLPPVIALEGLRAPQGLAAWSLIAMIGIVPTSMAYILYLTGLKLIDATKASVFAIVEPVSASILAFMFFHETLSPSSFLGFGLIISSIILISTRQKLAKKTGCNQT
jgi:drug/metabolite transporter (DMT)-like permease